MANVPEGQSKLIFENLSSVDLVFDLSGLTRASAVIPPSGKQEFIIEPGAYTYNGHQPGGAFSVAPGTFDIAPNSALTIACFDGSNCEQRQTVQPAPIQSTDVATGTAPTAVDTAPGAESATPQGTTQEGQQGTDQEGTDQEDQSGTDQDGEEGTDQDDQSDSTP
jgi:hypothetical protein